MDPVGLLVGVDSRDVVHAATVQNVRHEFVIAACNICSCIELQDMQLLSAMERTSQITKYRKSQGQMSLEAFGMLFTPPVDKSTVLRWELGKITPRRAIEIEDVTGISRSALLPEFFNAESAA